MEGVYQGTVVGVFLDLKGTGEDQGDHPTKVADDLLGSLAEGPGIGRLE